LIEKYQTDSLESAFVEIVGAEALREEAQREAQDKKKKRRIRRNR